MLKNINPLLTGSLRKALADMGHSDTVVIVDGNFPAYRMGPTVVELPGITAPQAVAAICSVLPLDQDHPPFVMDDGSGELLAIHRELLDAAGWAGDGELVDRWDYYPRVAAAELVVATGERRTWANLGLAKGLV
jgi:L-fucose mutarotase